VNLATKLPSWLIKSRADMDRYLDEQLKRLQTDHIDFYLVHGLMEPFWENLSALGVTDFLDSAMPMEGSSMQVSHSTTNWHYLRIL